MDLGIHRQLVLQAAPADFSTTILNLVIVPANLSTDLNQFDSKLHFDNCAFAQGLDCINDRWSSIASGSSTYFSFGRLTHTIQDFYAHSNWVELHQDISPIPIWDLNLSSLPPEIVSGVFDLDKTPTDQCGPGAPTHAELNKDNPTSTEGQKVILSGPNQGKTMFDLAYEAALAATRVQFARLATVMPKYNSTAYVSVVNNFSGNANITLHHQYSTDPKIDNTWTAVAPGAVATPPMPVGYNTGLIHYGMDWWGIEVNVLDGKDAGTWVVNSKECMLESADNGKSLMFTVSPTGFILAEISGSCDAGWSQTP